MELRPFGRTGLDVSAIGYGCWEIGGGYGDIEEAEFVRAVGRSLDLGINCFDTAEGYGMGASERALGASARRAARRGDHRHQVRDELPRQAEPPRQQPRARDRVDRQEPEEPRHRLRRRVPRALARPVDPVRGDDASPRRHRPRRQGPLRRPLELQAGRDRGVHGGATCRRRAVRLEHVRPPHADARSCPTARSRASASWPTGRSRFGLLTGTFTEDHDFGSTDWRARQGNMGAIKMFGALFGPEKFKDNVRAVEELKGIAARYDKSLPQLALRWAISNPAVSTALVGCRTVAEVEDNVGAIGWSISDDDLAEIDAIFERHGVDTTPDFWIEEDGVIPYLLPGRSPSSPVVRAAWDAASWSSSSRRAASVVIADVDRDAGEALAAELGATTAFKQTDVARGGSDPGRRRLRSRAVRWPARHVQQRRRRRDFKRFLDDDFADFDRVMAVNIFGVMVGSQRAARYMAEHGGGAIVNTTSIGGINAGAGVMAYRATKAAVIHVTRSIAVELAGQGHPCELRRAGAHPDRDQRELRPVADRESDAAAAASRITARRRGGRPLPGERPGGTDHRRRAPRRRRHHRRLAAALDQASPGRAVGGTEVTAAGNAPDLCSCDDHLDLHAMPTDLWVTRLAGAQAEHAPHVVVQDGRPFWICEDRVMGRSGMGKSALAKSLSAIGRAGIDDDGFRAGTPELRLQDMDRDGLRASVIYGPLSLGFPHRRPRVGEACYAAWNDWAVEEFNAAAPDRLCVLAFLPGRSPEAAAAELERCAALGHRGAIIGVFDIDAGDPSWDRLWAAAAQTGLPISFHIRGGTSSKLSYQIGKWQSAAFASAPAAPARRTARDDDLLWCVGASPRPHAGAGRVGHRLVAVLLGADGPRVGEPARQARLRAGLPPSELFRSQVWPRSRRSRWPPSSSRCSAPTPACGHPTIRTPTARSRTPGRR